jgi:prepilin-type N-terminal cleavage/methylation domain-containing protein/prepilin-type processing-associated H-X9-DG protein
MRWIRVPKESSQTPNSGRGIKELPYAFLCLDWTVAPSAIGGVGTVAARAASPRAFSVGGFTLLELLVVIAVLTTLAALLLPVLAQSKSRAHAIQCLNNLRQLHLAWQMYADDHGDRLVPNWYSEAVESDPIQYRSWARGVMTFWPDHPDNTNTSYLIHGLLGPYARAAGIFKCPVDQSTARQDGRLYPRVRTAAMNHWMGFEDTAWSSEYRHFLRTSDLVGPDPAEAFVFTMQREDAIEDAWMRIDMGLEVGSQIQWPESYHQKAANFTFGDGHAERHRWIESETSPPVKRGLPIQWWTAGAMIPSDTNADHIWIRQHATRRIQSAETDGGDTD